MSDEQPTTESPPVEENTPKVHPRLSSLIAIFVVVTVVILVLAFDVWPTNRRNVLERGAKRTLRVIGSAQLAYQGTNNDKNYGSLKALQEGMYIHEDKTLDNLIEGYRLYWEAPNFNYFALFGNSGIGSHKFTIIAYPSLYYPPNLHTFAITESQRVRVYNPDNGNQLNVVSTWNKVD